MGSSIGFSDDQYHKPISNEVLEAYISNGSHISYSKTGNRKDEDILHSGFSNHGYSLSERSDKIRIFRDYVLDLVYLTAKGNLSGYGDGSFDFLDETSQGFSIIDYTLDKYCFENLLLSSKVGEKDSIFRGKAKILKKEYNSSYFGDSIDRRDYMETVQKILLVITIIGAINWGLIGILDFNLVDTIFGAGSMLSRIIYSLVGISGLINIGILFNHIESR